MASQLRLIRFSLDEVRSQHHHRVGSSVKEPAQADFRLAGTILIGPPKRLPVSCHHFPRLYCVTQRAVFPVQTLARELVARALAAMTPAAWLTGDKVYGSDYHFGRFCEDNRLSYVVAISSATHLAVGGLVPVGAQSLRSEKDESNSPLQETAGGALLGTATASEQ